MDVIDERTDGASREDLVRRLADRLADAVPAGAQVLRADLQRNFGAVLSALEARVATLEAERDARGA